jgi:CRISPR-associated protein Cas2
MARKKKPELTFAQRMFKLKRAGIEGSPPPNAARRLKDELEELSVRIQRILGIVAQHKKKAGDMIFFVMYDIESNKVRNLVAKYLIRQGCIRIQKSVFLADTDRSVFNQIRKDLAEVQECYENEDSIVMVPVSTDEIQAMKVIGRNIDADLVLKTKNTIIF